MHNSVLPCNHLPAILHSSLKLITPFLIAEGALLLRLQVSETAVCLFWKSFEHALPLSVQHMVSQRIKHMLPPVTRTQEAAELGTGSVAAATTTSLSARPATSAEVPRQKVCVCVGVSTLSDSTGVAMQSVSRVLWCA